MPASLKKHSSVLFEPLYIVYNPGKSAALHHKTLLSDSCVGGGIVRAPLHYQGFQAASVPEGS